MVEPPLDPWEDGGWWGEVDGSDADSSLVGGYSPRQEKYAQVNDPTIS